MAWQVTSALKGLTDSVAALAKRNTVIDVTCRPQGASSRAKARQARGPMLLPLHLTLAWLQRSLPLPPFLALVWLRHATSTAFMPQRWARGLRGFDQAFGVEDACGSHACTCCMIMRALTRWRCPWSPSTRAHVDSNAMCGPRACMHGRHGPGLMFNPTSNECCKVAHFYDAKAKKCAINLGVTIGTWPRLPPTPLAPDAIG